MFVLPQSATLAGALPAVFPHTGAVDGTGSIWDLEGPTKACKGTCVS